MDNNKKIINQRYIDPLSDFGFKRLFGHEEIMIPFLNAVMNLENPIKSLEYIDKELQPEAVNGRNIIFDMLCKLDSGEEVIVEMQDARQKHFGERILFYMSRAITSQRKHGEGWDYGIDPINGVYLLNFEQEKGHPKTYRHLRLYDDDHEPFLPDKLQFWVLELPPYRKMKPEDCKNKTDYWLYNLANMKTMKDDLPFRSQISELEKLQNWAEICSMSEEELRQWDRRMKRQWDNYAVEECMKEEARAEGEAHVIEKLRRTLSEEQIQELLK